MTATAARPLKSIVLTACCPSKGDNERPPASLTAFGGVDDSSVTPLVLKTGKLKNLRNYYARRRPAISPPCRVSPPPNWIVSSEYHEDDEESVSSSFSSATVTRGVRFRPHVIVHEIPSRKDYSKAEKETMWTSRRELRRMILKNHTEFSFEGRDWRHAPEEDQFARDENGELVHPVHLALKRRKQSPEQVLQSATAGKKRNNSTVTTTLKKRLCLRKLPVSSDTNSCPSVVEAEEHSSHNEEEDDQQSE